MRIGFLSFRSWAGSTFLERTLVFDLRPNYMFFFFFFYSVLTASNICIYPLTREALVRRSVDGMINELFECRDRSVFGSQTRRSV